jgi:murein L,D-transpeptidase YcbB/YkuD
VPALIAGLLFLLLAGTSCKVNQKRPPETDIRLQGAINQRHNLPFDSNQVAVFYKTYPLLGKYEADVYTVYRQHRFHHIWFDEKGVVEFGHSLYSKTRNLEAEGVSATFPYMSKVEGVFESEIPNTLSNAETELMLTNLYLFYAEKVFRGIDEDTVKATGWLLPRKQVSYAGLLDTIVLDPQVLNRDDSVLFRQYYKLRDVLQKYREIEKKGGWAPIDLDPNLKAYKPGDSAKTILQIRERLFITGDLKQNSRSNRFDEELSAAVQNYQRRNGKNQEPVITPALIREMNVPIGSLIEKIVVNMERCRWITPDIVRAQELIVVNIPSFKLTMFRGGKNIFESPVVVGAVMTKTVIFSGMMSYIVFSPYWNLPQSIINKEVKKGMAKNPNYLAAHNMEWNNGQVRQKPGKNNSLGLVKFIFPNSNDIYLHDTPAKSLFAKESRAFSHGCIRVGKPRDLAVTILADDPDWTPKKIDAAMNAGRETSYTLKKKIPVYIGYFTAWVDAQGEICFYDDIYDRDNRLAALLISGK